MTGTTDSADFNCSPELLYDVRANGTGKTIFAPTGKDVLFGCPLNSSEPIVCETTPFGQSKPRSLYDGKMFLDEFRDSSRFGFLYSGIPGCPSLRINNVESNDAGRFNCYGSSNLYQCLYNLVVTDPRIYCRETVDPASTRMALGNRTASSQFGCNLNFRGSPTPNICLTGNGVPIATASAVNATAGNLTSASYQWSYPADINSTAFGTKPVNGTSVYPCSYNANVPWSSLSIYLELVNKLHPTTSVLDPRQVLRCSSSCTPQFVGHVGSNCCQPTNTLNAIINNFEGSSTFPSTPNGFIDPTSTIPPSYVASDAIGVIVFAAVVCLGLLTFGVVILWKKRRANQENPGDVGTGLMSMRPAASRD